MWAMQCGWDKGIAVPLRKIGTLQLHPVQVAVATTSARHHCHFEHFANVSFSPKESHFCNIRPFVWRTIHPHELHVLLFEQVRQIWFLFLMLRWVFAMHMTTLHNPNTGDRIGWCFRKMVIGDLQQCCILLHSCSWSQCVLWQCCLHSMRVVVPAWSCLIFTAH